MASFRDELGQLLNQDDDLARMAVPLPKKCTASSKTRWRDKEKGLRARCENTPMPGQRVCRYHGGKTPNSIAVAEERLQLRAAVSALRKLGERVEPWERIDPRDALLDVVQQAYVIKAMTEALLKDSEEDDLKGVGDTYTEQTELGPMTVPHRGGARVTMRLRLYNEALDRCARVSKIAMDVGIEERMVKLAEGQATEIVDVVRVATAALPDDMKMAVIGKVAEELKFRAAKRLAPETVAAAVATVEALPLHGEELNGHNGTGS